MRRRGGWQRIVATVRRHAVVAAHVARMNVLRRWHRGRRGRRQRSRLRCVVMHEFQSVRRYGAGVATDVPRVDVGSVVIQQGGRRRR